ncbi:LPS export ABC transporter periplasmic protein LptC [Rhodopseudomonas sp. B29]|uniref:LPS export ABC transporter periplasmic protein LptC n=1 Tax=Rhodopseudomonas sp. B29 TaxID=95607 RepID=UPI00034C80D2|nr:LPS export ABC transporter periplasmic protein LptC [Rhodopseudomonas sp. B29]
MASVDTASYQSAMNVRFAAAARHSRLVRRLRVAVPLVVVLSLAAIIAISVFNPFRYLSKLPLDVGDLVVSGSKITMEAPHLSGFTTDGRPYELWARSATQDLASPDHVDLHTMRSKILNADQSTITVQARDGKFNTKAQLLHLQKDVYMRTSTGTEAWLTQAEIDMGKSTMSSDEPVDVRWPGGTLHGQRLRVTDQGETMRFEGGVVMNIDNAGPMLPGTEAAAEPAKAEPAKTEPAPKSKPAATSRHRETNNR